MYSNRKLLATLVATIFISSYISPSSWAGQLEFDGVPVDITTADNEDLLIVPGTGGNTQIGTGTTDEHATTNNDLYVSGVLETDGVLYSDGGMIAGNDVVPTADATQNLGSSTKSWKNLYINNLFAG